MRIEDLQELHRQKLLDDRQYAMLKNIITGKIFSVYYELRIVLYLGVLLFTTGMGFLIYENIGDLGHLLSIFALSAVTLGCFFYAIKKAAPYAHTKTEVGNPYYDYVVLLGCLLFISVLGYVQYQYALFDKRMDLTTLATAFLFFTAAYRFDHLGVLSLGLTAWASFWGLRTSPQEWYSTDFFDDNPLHHTALVFGAVMTGIALVLDRKAIKSHFTFTYVNVCMLVYLVGATAGMFMNGAYNVYVLLVYAGCGFAVYFARLKKSFLFLIYAFVFGFIATTYLLADLLFNDPYTISLYCIISCGGFIYFIVKFRNYFKREA